MAEIDKKAEKLCKKFDKLIADRMNWTTHWDEVSQYIIPQKDNIYGFQVRGEKKNNNLFDTSAIVASERLASSLHGMLTNPVGMWFGLSTGNPKLDKRDPIQEYLQEVVRIMINTFNASNFQTEIHEVYLDLSSFGTSVLRVEEDDELDVRFHARPIYECAIQENFKGDVDTIFFEYEMTVGQIAEEFGEEVLDDDMKKRLETDPTWREKVIHAVQPVRKTIAEKIDTPAIGSMEFVSYHILKKSKQTLRVKGFFENPYIVTRWSKIAGEIYGRSPGMKALPDVKMINKMKRANIEAAQLAISPPLQAPDDGVLLPIKTAPKSINFYRAGTKDRIEPMITGSRPDIGDQQIAQVEAKINEAFFIDQLSVPLGDRATATEVIQRRDEQLRVLGPILGRQHHELLKPLVERVFNILERRGKLPEPPEELLNQRIEVQYTSQIAKAQKSSEGEQIMKGLQMMSPFLEIDPRASHNLDADQAIRLAAEIYQIPHELIRNEADVKRIREAEAAAAQQQSEMQNMQVEADVLQKTANVQGT